MSGATGPRWAVEAELDLGAIRIQPLGTDHDRGAFSCGVPALDHYLREQAGQDARPRVAVPFVATADGANVLGFHTLSATSIRSDPRDRARPGVAGGRDLARGSTFAGTREAAALSAKWEHRTEREAREAEGWQAKQQERRGRTRKPSSRSASGSKNTWDDCGFHAGHG